MLGPVSSREPAPSSYRGAATPVLYLTEPGRLASRDHLMWMGPFDRHPMILTGAAAFDTLHQPTLLHLLLTATILN